MSFSVSTNVRTGVLYLLLISFACLPIWSVERYFNQDGSPHLYNAYIILELFKNNPAFTQIYALNSAPLPNLSGHYLLSFLLIFFSPTVVTKLFVTFTFAAFAAAVGWLRFQVAGRTEINLSLLLGAALAFNWMWFLGFYNFIIGAVVFTFALGLYWRWRENLNLFRSLVLAILLVCVFFCHLISFGMLAGSFLLMAVFVSPSRLRNTLTWTLATFLPVLPLVFGYKLLSEKGGEMHPVWNYLDNPMAVSNWAMQLQTADPFQLLSRKSFPFSAAVSNFYAVFSPFLWLAAALVCLTAGTLFFNRREIFKRELMPFFIIGVLSIVFWIFAPDDFGESHGGFLRERVLLCGLICFIPLYRMENARFLKWVATVCLLFVIVFQTAVLWQYALDSERLSLEYLSGQSLIADTDSLASIVLIEDGCRYKANPLANLTTLYGIGKNTRIWDNYEIGYYLFPVTAKNPLDSRFTFDFREAGFFNLCSKNDLSDEKFSRIKSLLDSNNDKISVILVWGDDGRILPTLNKWYEDTPFFQNGRVRLFRHRRP